MSMITLNFSAAAGYNLIVVSFNLAAIEPGRRINRASHWRILVVCHARRCPLSTAKMVKDSLNRIPAQPRRRQFPGRAPHLLGNGHKVPEQTTGSRMAWAATRRAGCGRQNSGPTVLAASSHRAPGGFRPESSCTLALNLPIGSRQYV